MKKVTIYDDLHREVKAEAAREGRTFPNMASELIRMGLEAFRNTKRKPSTAKSTAK